MAKGATSYHGKGIQLAIMAKGQLAIMAKGQLAIMAKEQLAIMLKGANLLSGKRGPTSYRVKGHKLAIRVMGAN